MGKLINWGEFLNCVTYVVQTEEDEPPNLGVRDLRQICRLQHLIKRGDLESSNCIYPTYYCTGKCIRGTQPPNGEGPQGCPCCCLSQQNLVGAWRSRSSLSPLWAPWAVLKSAAIHWCYLYREILVGVLSNSGTSDVVLEISVCFLPACKKVLHVVVIGRPHSSSDRVLKPLQRHHGAPTSLFQASGVCFWTPGSAEQNCIDYVWQKAEARPNRESLCGLDECEFQRRWT